ncbi:uncharacterized protein LOC113227942 isoform X1 [Hyposmocoma kahamanoa]|uniref:uncharacterized protein LOC113227942 isoform X1 n=1 Tax=Hyposmocoma kahamanoa TaxID=1477025 RepID=UPI000E6D64F9|nr:uncharacterized protein LOC113227942 isoform X1 [Hyposmocoma kahamanoa]
MKAITAVCATGASVPTIARGRVQRQRDGENAEIQMYLSKLQALVPCMPKNRKISKLEVIQHVIDYICDLQSALENHPAADQFDVEAALAGEPLAALPRASTPERPPRRPLGPRVTPNTILTSTPTTLAHELRTLTVSTPGIQKLSHKITFTFSIIFLSSDVYPLSHEIVESVNKQLQSKPLLTHA